MAETERSTEVKFDFIKSNSFRVVHADGVFGGPTPQRQLAITFFNERAPVPRQVTHPVLQDGSLGTEIEDKRVVRDAIVREFEVCVLLNFEVARNLHEWLGRQMDQHRAATEQLAKKE